jgi:ribosomal protein L29
VEAWTDERLDDLAATLRPLPAQMARNTEALERIADEIATLRADNRAEFAALRGEMGAVRGESGAEIASLRADTRAEFASLRADTRAEFASLRADLSAFHRQIAQIGWGMATAVIGLLIALIIATL